MTNLLRGLRSRRGGLKPHNGLGAEGNGERYGRTHFLFRPWRRVWRLVYSRTAKCRSADVVSARGVDVVWIDGHNVVIRLPGRAGLNAVLPCWDNIAGIALRPSRAHLIISALGLTWAFMSITFVMYDFHGIQFGGAERILDNTC